MRTLVRWIVRLVLVVAVVVGSLMVYAQFHDGPLGLVAGGSFASGETSATNQPDWEAIKDINTVEFELIDPGSSRTTWLVTHDGRAFIPCGYMNSTLGKLWKHWPHKVAAAPNVILRINGVLYDRKLVRVQEGPILQPVLSELSRKYINQPIPESQVTSGNLWIFELVERDS